MSCSCWCLQYPHRIWHLKLEQELACAIRGLHMVVQLGAPGDQAATGEHLPPGLGQQQGQAQDLKAAEARHRQGCNALAKRAWKCS